MSLSDYQNLVKDTLKFLSFVWKEGSQCHFQAFGQPLKSDLPLPGPSSQKSEIPIKESLPIASPPLHSPSPQEELPKKESKFQFDLQISEPNTLLSVEPFKELSKKLFPQLKLCEVPSPILLAAFNASSEELHFLTKVADVLSKTIAPAQVISLQPSESPPPCLFLLAPLTKESKKFQIHQLGKWRGGFFLPLAPLNAYLEGIELKRALWNTLKTLPFPNMLRSYSTSPSINPSTTESPSLSSKKSKKAASSKSP